jgi:YHS domain-containing protein
MKKIIHSLSKTSKFTLIGFWAIALMLNWTSPGNAFKKVNQTSWGVAIKGYDTVAYHTEGRAVKGQSTYSHEWNDAKWYFASAENRDLFAADPERYAPQYGGY